jgi:hypothetical protein
MPKEKITIEIECSNALEKEVTSQNLQKLCDRLKGGGVNKLMKMYENPLKKVVVDAFFKGNGI